MNTSRILLITAAAIALGGTFMRASAQDQPAQVDVVRSALDGHAYQNGGISKEQVADMDLHMKPYDLRLTFSEGKYNDYITALKLEIVDAGGRKVFSLDDAGPLTDVNLPAGHYRVVADFGGVKRSAGVDVKPGEPARLYLHWPKDET